MAGNIHADFFLESADTEEAENVEHVKVHSHGNARPYKDKQDSKQLDSEKCEVTASLPPFVEPSGVLPKTKGYFHTLWFREESS